MTPSSVTGGTDPFQLAMDRQPNSDNSGCYDNKFVFQSVELFKDQTLGIGSYGKVCKAKGDELMCAAKVLHETLLDPKNPKAIAHKTARVAPIRKFENECELLRGLRHPNIVLYLGTHQDPDTGLLVILLELMDNNLTQFLEWSKPQPIPYHIQVNICHDVALALSFLHACDIVHRDLSSNNVLMIANVRAKVSDFGMARLGDHMDGTLTRRPGADAYMPPETLQSLPRYNEKIDCFSFGVLTLQILTQLLPMPTNMFERSWNESLKQPGRDVRVAEIVRRQNHIRMVNPQSHPLLSVVRDCLADNDVDRPPAVELCKRLSSLKESTDKDNVPASAQATFGTTFDPQTCCKEKKERIYTLEQLLKAKDATIKEKNEQLQCARERDADNEKLISELLSHQDLNKEVGPHQTEYNPDHERKRTGVSWAESRTRVCNKLRWNVDVLQAHAPSSMNSINASITADISNVYIQLLMGGKTSVYSCHVSTLCWFQLPPSPNSQCPLVIIKGVLTSVGGMCNGQLTNKLFYLIPENQSCWIDTESPMPTARREASTLCIGKALIVAGGSGGPYGGLCSTVEVMDIHTREWSVAVSLPGPMRHPSMVSCRERLYILAEKSMYTCLSKALFESCTSRVLYRSSSQPGAKIWMRVNTPLPMTNSAFVTVNNRLLAVGGKDSSNKASKAIHMYNAIKRTWEVISEMSNARYDCLASVVSESESSNILIIIGGGINQIVNQTDCVELAETDNVQEWCS